MRTEIDFLGKVEIPDDALYGIHSVRARENFPGEDRFSMEWYKAVGLIKLSFYKSAESFIKSLRQEHPNKEWGFRIPDLTVIEALQEAATEVSKGMHFNHFIAPAVQGGAGTSINMNINEILANRACNILGYKLGSYDVVDPIDSANIYQSTNDTIPSALRVAAMFKLEVLEKAVNQLRKEFEQKEAQYRDTLRIAYTQYQEAVPSSYGKLFSSYTDALSRDWWRISKGKERIKTINLGGSAVGTGLTVPRYVLIMVVDQLRSLTKLPVSRAENLADATANQDDLVELHGLLKTLAVNLEKISGDIRILSSDLSSDQGFLIPSRQVGSSIMPGKVNPVIPEFVISSSHQVFANDTLVASLASKGSLELNPYIPQIGHAILGSLDLLVNACQSLALNCVSGIEINEQKSIERVLYSPSLTTALIPTIGYKRATEMAKFMKDNKCSIIEANDRLKVIATERLSELIKPEKLLRMGFSVKDI